VGQWIDRYVGRWMKGRHVDDWIATKVASYVDEWVGGSKVGM